MQKPHLHSVNNNNHDFMFKTTWQLSYGLSIVAPLSIREKQMGIDAVTNFLNIHVSTISQCMDLSLHLWLPQISYQCTHSWTFWSIQSIKHVKYVTGFFASLLEQTDNWDVWSRSHWASTSSRSVPEPIAVPCLLFTDLQGDVVWRRWSSTGTAKHKP